MVLLLLASWFCLTRHLLVLVMQQTQAQTVFNNGGVPQQKLYDLNPDHTHFILLDDDPDTDAEGLNSFRLGLETRFTKPVGKPRRCQYSQSGIPPAEACGMFFLVWGRNSLAVLIIMKVFCKAQNLVCRDYFKRVHGHTHTHTHTHTQAPAHTSILGSFLGKKDISHWDVYNLLDRHSTMGVGVKRQVIKPTSDLQEALWTPVWCRQSQHRWWVCWSRAVHLTLTTSCGC